MKPPMLVKWNIENGGQISPCSSRHTAWPQRDSEATPRSSTQQDCLPFGRCTFSAPLQNHINSHVLQEANAPKCFLFYKGKSKLLQIETLNHPNLVIDACQKKNQKKHQGSSSATLPLNDNLIKEKNLISHSMILPMQMHMSFFFPHCNSWKRKNVTFFKWEMLRSVF